jgi:hypothetical protein
MTAAHRIIKWLTALAVLSAAAVAAVVSYEHASTLVQAHGESGWTALDPVDSRQVDLREFDSDAGLGAAGCPGTRTGELAPRLGYCRDAGARTPPWPRG